MRPSHTAESTPMLAAALLPRCIAAEHSNSRWAPPNDLRLEMSVAAMTSWKAHEMLHRAGQEAAVGLPVGQREPLNLPCDGNSRHEGLRPSEYTGLTTRGCRLGNVSVGGCRGTAGADWRHSGDQAFGPPAACKQTKRSTRAPGRLPSICLPNRQAPMSPQPAAVVAALTALGPDALLRLLEGAGPVLVGRQHNAWGPQLVEGVHG